MSVFFSSVFWFWLWCLALLGACCRGGIYYILVCIVVRLEVLGKLLVLVIPTIVRVFLQMYMDLSWKEMRVDDWGLFVWVFFGFVGGSSDVVGGDWCGVCWLAILELFSFESCFRRNFVFTVILLKKRIKSIVANATVTIAFFIHLHTVNIRDIKNVKNIIKRRKTSVLLNRCLNI